MVSRDPISLGTPEKRKQESTNIEYLLCQTLCWVHFINDLLSLTFKVPCDLALHLAPHALLFPSELCTATQNDLYS